MRGCSVAAVLFALATSVVSAQDPVPAPPGTVVQQAQAAAAAIDERPVMRLTAADAVRLATENNLGIVAERFNPQISTLTIEGTRGAWTPSLAATVQTRGNTSPNNSFLSGAVGNSTSDRSFSSTAQLQQTVPWGANYSVGWDAARSTTDSLFSNFSPQLRSTLSMSYSQQLWRGFNIDATRQQLETNLRQRDIANVQLRQTIATTARSVRMAYWDLVFALASLRVQQQSLELAVESLRNTRTRIEIGTTPPIDEIAPQAEVARREEAVITAEAQIETAEDNLRTLIFKSDDPDFWEIRIQPVEAPEFQSVSLDIDAAVRSALDNRTDLAQARTQLLMNDISIRYLRDQTRPDVVADLDYGLAGLGGTQFTRLGGDLFADRIQVGQRGFGSVLGDIFTNAYPTWTTALRVTVPVGRNPQESSLARARLEFRQAETQLRNQQLQVAAQVRQAARQVVTNQKRVDTTRSARELSERMLDAEQRKLTAGTSENFQVLQAQRDLAQARNDELRAVIDYQQSVVDLETVQQVPLR
jgi:outer membrane protein TolC